ncbi:MAG: 2-deoxyglucose-6-phosphate hydrolase YniC [Ferruginibacter sp.]|nr:2-deoxyglucose-6-phosphate hydrolase YniC [Ferruginibacter sp.]
MKLNTVIFDMDGLLIDSEPLWNEAADEAFQQYGFRLTPAQHAITTGMRTKEFVEWWFDLYKIPMQHVAAAQQEIFKLVIDKVAAKGRAMQGVAHIFNFFIDRDFKIGLATSSGKLLIDVVVDKLGIRNYLHAIASAAELPYGKPHPQVFLNCADQLKSSPLECICFEDSFNGMIAVKAARMKCVVVPARYESQHAKFNAADLKISSLQNFNELLLHTL